MLFVSAKNQTPVSVCVCCSNLLTVMSREARALGRTLQAEELASLNPTHQFHAKEPVGSRHIFTSQRPSGALD